MSNRSEELGRERSDHKYKLERLMFQLKTKEETIVCLKTQATQAETHFKEQIDRIRDDLIMKQSNSGLGSYMPTLGRNRIDTSISGEIEGVNTRPRREVALKIAIQ